MFGITHNKVNMRHLTKTLSLAWVAGLVLAACTAPMTPPIKPKTPLPVAWQTRAGDSLNEIALHDGMAFVVNENNRLIALDAKTGAKRWETSLNLVNSHDNAVGADGRRVFALTGQDKVGIIAFDAKTGAKLWEIANATNKTAPFPVVGAGHVMFETPVKNGAAELRAVDAAGGKEAWSFPLSGTLGSEIILQNDAAIFGVNQWDGANVKTRRVVALDAATGTQRWETPLDLNFAGGISADADRVYLGMEGGVVQARDAGTGAPAWTARIGGRISAPPTAMSDRVYATNSDGVVTALNAGDGSEIWSRDVKSAILTQVAEADGVAYFGTNDGYLHALDAATGAEKWKEQSPERRPVVPGPYVPAMGTTPVVAGDLLLYFNGDALNALKLR